MLEEEINNVHKHLLEMHDEAYDMLKKENCALDYLIYFWSMLRDFYARCCAEIGLLGMANNLRTRM